MKFLSLALLVAVASATDCTDDNVVAAKKAVEKSKLDVAAQKKLVDAEGEAIKKAELQKKLDELTKAGTKADGDLIFAQNSCTPGDAAPEPIDAAGQLAKSNNAKAVTELTEWKTLTDSEAKQGDKYDALDAEGKKAWDAKRVLHHEAIALREKTEKETSGFAKLTVEQQTVYLAGLYAWKQAKYKQCKAEPDSNECKMADKLRAVQEKKRATDGFYAKDKAAREKDDAAASAAKEADLKELVAAATPVKKPDVVGKVAKGSSCAKVLTVRPACLEGHCCGKATKGFFGASKEICEDKTLTKVSVKTGDVSEDWGFACITGAKQLAAGLATAAVASFMMA